jgi:hypothetical protein
VPTPATVDWVGPEAVRRKHTFPRVARHVHSRAAMRSVTVLALLSILLGASSCSTTEASSPAAAPDTWKASEAASGTRLHARFLVAGDAREHAGFHDTQRNEDCTFQPAESGRMRCLPPTLSYVTGATFFADATCKTAIQVIATPPPTCSDAKYAIGTSYDQATCTQAPTEVRRVLAPTTVFQNAGAGCTPVATPVVALGELVPWTDFVGGATTAGPGATDALGEAVLVGDDGAKQHQGFRSATLDETCAFEIMADGVARCVPEGRVGPVYFSDPACIAPAAALVTGGGCGKTQAERFLLPATSAAGAVCNALRGVYALDDYAGSESSDLYFYSSNGSATTEGSCNSVSSLGGGYGQQRRALKTDLTPSLPVATRVSGRSGRLVPALVSEGDTRALTPGWHDNDQNTDCTFKVASDGKMRCLPTTGQFLLFSTDDACTSPTRIAAPTTPSCSGTSSRFAIVTSTTCPATTKVFSLGTDRRDLQAASTETAPGRCVKVGGLAGGYDATEVDPALFVEGVLATE